MKPKRFPFRGNSLRYGAPAVFGFAFAISGLTANAGDILRGGSAASNKAARASAGSPTPAATDAARANAKDTLARTTRTLAAMSAMQNAARDAAIRNGANSLTVPSGRLPAVPNGIAIGALNPTADSTKWTGADAAVQKIKNGKTEVTVTQTAQQALLEWQTLNVGKKTTLTFDQSKGGADASKWIAFNKITDPSGNPTQILGQIKAQGQVYIINPNGIIFGGGSQVNARGLTVSSLPINDNLIRRGLLNNPDAQFLFSGLSVPGGADGTPDFTPVPLPEGSPYGDVIVQKGAVLTSPASAGGNGGRILLVGPNVTNEGTISTESGQTILAAGLQVGVSAHDGSDPSLRGLDVWIGEVGAGSGTAKNTGIISAHTGSTWMAGKNVEQLGAIDSTTSVNLNGRVDLVASYGAVANPNFDSATEVGAGGPIFFSQYTGVVTLGEGSVTRILPDYASKSTVPGTALPQRSRVNIEGKAIHLEKEAILFAPNAEVNTRAGTWQYRDLDGNRSVLGADGKVGSDLVNHFTGSAQKFFFDRGQIYLAESSVISVAGSVDVFVPLAQNILTVQLRGSELADSPIQRDTVLKGATLTVDIRNTGIYDGKYWIGTPLGDVTGLAGLISRNAAQLTAVGGNITLRSGGSIVAGKHSALDVSGGSYHNEGGVAKTSYLISGGRLVDIKDATPDQVYSGVFNGEFTVSSAKWGVSETFATPLFSGTSRDSFAEGAAGGTLTLTAPSMALDGELRGTTTSGPRQRATPPAAGKLILNFEFQRRLDISPSSFVNISASPSPPAIIFADEVPAAAMPRYSLTADEPASLPTDRLATVFLSKDLVGSKGFGALEITNPDGSITLPPDVTLSAPTKGSVSFSAANVSILGQIVAPGGKLSFTTFNISPTFATEYKILFPAGTAPLPHPVPGRGIFNLGGGAELSTAFGLVDDSHGIDYRLSTAVDGGGISINSYQASLDAGAKVDVSGGAYISSQGKVSYGKGGSISVITGLDPGFTGAVGGNLTLGATLAGYSGSTGGTLAIQAGRISIGGISTAGVLGLDDEFFRKGGFTSYSLAGIGAASPAVPETYQPAISIAAGSRIAPQAESLIVVPDPTNEGRFLLEKFLDARGSRAPVSLGFTALGSDDPFTLDSLEVRGDIVMGRGAAIQTDPGASVTFKGGTVSLLGSVITPGGTISISGANAFPLTATQRVTVTHALATVHIGSEARLSAAGVTQLVPDDFGRRIGKVYDGGTISISGNIVAEKGSLMDVSGTSDVLDIDPLLSARPGATVGGGLISTPFQQASVATRIDSDGGIIDLSGSQVLLSDATLRGGAGGLTAAGGRLSVFSGNYLPEGGSRTNADVNLTAKQSGDVIANPGGGVGQAYPSGGIFAIDRFTEGSFTSLDLGGKYITSGNLPFGGNIDFQGKINLAVDGTLRLAAGGVIHADDTVNISASRIQVGQDFRQPQHPDDKILIFQKDPAFPSPEYFLPPTAGNGSLNLSADLIDVGTLSLQNIGKANLFAKGGDIRGNGTLSLAGDLTLSAAQIYPTTLGKFDIFAYDHDGQAGSVKIRGSGTAAAPLSAGGSLSVYASHIEQSGVLRAPLGTIHLGWEGLDSDKPYDIIAGTTIAVPVTAEVTLDEGSLTSVSAKGLTIPYGISPDGTTWIDPRGVNITLSGLPEKSVFISGGNVRMNSGAVVDIGGGGDLFATRWVAGNGGSRDLLGEASAVWGSGTQYQPGDLVMYRGQTWSARTRNSGETPGANLYWSAVRESFAIVPDFNAAFAPYAAYNTGANAGALAGNPGYLGGNLKAGDRITLDGSDGLPAGTYTLLPRGYANLQGAFLVTATDIPGSGMVKAADGSNFVSGYLSNVFNSPEKAPAITRRFEVASSAVVKNRVTYEIYSANKFIGKAGGTSLLPIDAGYAAFHGNTALALEGSLLTAAAGRGARVDIGSFSDIHLSSGKGVSQVTLNTGTLNSWGVESLLIGGIRTRGANGTRVDVRTNSLTLDNPGEILSGAEIILASKGTLTVTGKTSLASSGKMTAPAENLLIEGDGALLRVSADPAAGILRSGLTGSAAPLLVVAGDAGISGTSVIFDSTYGTVLSPEANIESRFLTLGSGQISVVFDDVSLPLEGSVIDPHLTLAGVTLDNVRKSEALTLLSYRTIDFYGTGTLGGSKLQTITLSGGGVRGYRQGEGDVLVRANDVRFENPVNVPTSAAPPTQAGRFTVDAKTVRLGTHGVAVSGYDTFSLLASDRVIFKGEGSLSAAGNLKIDAPRVTGAGGANYTLNATGDLKLTGGGASSPFGGGLGASLTLQGASISADTDIALPSGQLTLRATDGSIKVGESLSVAGSFRGFDGLMRYSDAGSITLESLTGDVSISSGGAVSVAGSAAGGNAGYLTVSAAEGEFTNAGRVIGETAVGAIGSDGWTSGSFALDAGSLADLVSIGKSLDAGGFHASRNFRARSGDVTLSGTHTSHEFALSADRGNILVSGTIDASGKTGGTISLAAHGDLIVAGDARLNASAANFDSAGKGGSILLEAGTQLDGIANTAATLVLQAGSAIGLGVDDFVAGSYTQPGSSAFGGKFTGTLHLRAPRTAGNDGLGIGSIGSNISGASSVVVEGYKTYTPAGGVLDIALRNEIDRDSTAFLGVAGAGNANEATIHGKLLAGTKNASALDHLLVIAPGVEILNLSGDLTLGLANPTGSTNVEALAAADWDLSGFRYGSRGAAGILTLRASGDVVFNNTLSDGFIPIAQGSSQVFADNGHSLMWLATLATVKDTLPVNTQSWSYRLTAGADLASANYRGVLSERDLDPGKGSVLIGEFYPAVPNTQTFGTAAGIGSNGQTADIIRISTTTTNRGNRFEVVRTGTGDITVSAGRDVQLRNQFSTIYTAGVALPDPTTIFSAGDFVVPQLPTRSNGNPSQAGGPSGNLGASQQIYPATWSMAGGNIAISAQSDIGRYTMVNGVLTVDSSRQLPTSWLYRRGYVDSATGLFANDGGVDSDLVATRVTDTATSTTWWVDYTNFFEGIGALGGGNVSLVSGKDIVNVDAVTPTNARMPGRVANPDFGVVSGAPEFVNVAPDASKLVELGGGDVTVRAGRNIDGGAYYVERGTGTLFAGGEITTNGARSPSLGILDGTRPLDPLTWLPTTLFVGKSSFDVAARGDVLIGPVANPFLLPQGLNNRFYYKSYFNTYSADAGANVASYGGDVTHRMAVNPAGGASATPILSAWYGTQQLFTGDSSAANASFYQPWLRLAELGLTSFNQVFSLNAPNLTSTAFGGDLSLVGSWTLAPSAKGNLELLADGAITGLQEIGPGFVNGRVARIWTASRINVSDASPDSIPGIATPIAYQSVAGRDRVTTVQSVVNILQNTDNSLAETGSFKDTAGASSVKQALHAAGLLHSGDANPVRLFAGSSDITGLTLFSPKETRITAGRDISDVAFYLQNVGKDDIALVSAGRDIVPFAENGALREIANNVDLGNAVGDASRKTAGGNSTNALAGDIQINGPGTLEVLAGRDIDLGTGANFTDGTGTGITSIGNNRNPSLPFGGADLVILGGLGGVAQGLSASSLDFTGFIGKYLPLGVTAKDSDYLKKIGWTGDFAALTPEQQAIVALEKYYTVLRDAGRHAAKVGNYKSGFAAIRTLFGKEKPEGEILTRAREIRTTSGGSISLAVAGGGITMASDIFGNPLTPPGIVTEYGGSISTFTEGDVAIGQARIFTLRGGDITMWSSHGDIAAGTSPKTVVTAPPTRVVIDITSADVQTDLGGLATGGGIGVLASVEGVKAGNVDLIAPNGTVDAGDAGIRVTGNLNIAAQVVLNSSNISAGGVTTGASPGAPSAPSVSAVTTASNASAAATAAVTNPAAQQQARPPVVATPSVITVEVIGYGGGSGDDEEDKDKEKDKEKGQQPEP